jgi:N-acetylmuramoyl-L-alanine amidase
MVRDHHIAWHAGKSRWKEYVNLNNNSLGIELVNKGHQYGYQNFTNKQINSLIKLCNKLKKKYFVKKENFLGHSDIAPLRKNDPGEKFPWKKLSSHNIGKWYVIKPFGVMINSKKMKALFFSNIKKLGYRYCKKDKKNSDNLRLVKSFQQHYLPKRVTGRIDKKTYKISHFLAN